MFRLTRSQVLPIGLDIGRSAVRMLQLEVAGDDLMVRASAREELTPEARTDPALRMSLVTTAVRKMLRSGFVGRQVVAALPREMVHVKNFRLPLMPAGELESAVKLEAANLFQFDIESAQVRFLAAGEVRQGNDVVQEVVAFAARNEEVDAYVEQVHRCGLLVNSIDIEQCALYRSIERFIRRREDEQEVHVLVDVGLGGSQVVVGRGKEISFVKSIEIGGFHLHQAVSRRLGIGMDEAQALRRRLADEPDGDKKNPVRQAVFDSTRSVMEQLAKEIALCLRYYSVTFRGHRPSKVRLSGGEARDGQFQSVLQSGLGIAVEAASPLMSVDVQRMKSSERRSQLSEWALVLGLALKRTDRHFGPRDGRSRKLGPPVVETVDEKRTEEAPGAPVGAGVGAPVGAAVGASAGATVSPGEPAARATREEGDRA